MRGRGLNRRREKRGLKTGFYNIAGTGRKKENFATENNNL